jgi:hypothetical protein
MIVPVRVIEEPRRILRAAPAGIEVDDALSISEQVSSGTGVAVPRSGSPRLPRADDGQMCPHFGHMPSRILWVSRGGKSGFVQASETDPNLSWP